MKSGFDVGYTREHLDLIEMYGSMFVVIWLLDETISIENDSQCINITNELRVCLGLQNIEQHVYKFYNVQTCIDQLYALNDRSVILFISRNEPLRDTDYSSLCELAHVEYIYQFGSDIPCRKIRGEVFTNIDQLLQVESDLYITPPNLMTTSMENLDNETKTFISMQLFMELLQKISCTERERDDFIGFCRNMCGERRDRLEQIRKYQECCLEKPAIWFYTGETCIHRFVNRVLREKNPISMIKIHYFVNQLFSELKRLYISQLSTKLKNKIQVYRGKLISVEELHRFQRAVKRLAFTDSFVSTSKNKTVALKFNGEGESESENKVSVLFTMTIAAHDNSSKPMAFIDQYLQDDHENEFLLAPGVIFCINSVKKIGKNMWEIKLVRDVAEEKFEKQLYLKLWEQISLMNPFVSMAYLLQKVNSPDVVNEYCNEMANLLQIVDPEISTNLRQIALDFQPFPALPQPIIASTSIQTRLMDSFGRMYRYLRSHPCRLIGVIVAAILLITILILIIVLPIVFESRTSVSITDGGSVSLQCSNCQYP